MKYLKRLSALFLMISLLLFILSPTVNYSKTMTINVIVDGVTVVFTDATGYPHIDEHNRTLIPLRTVMEVFGAEVTYNSLEKKAIIEKNGIYVEVPIGEKYLLRNGVKVTFDTNAIIQKGRTYIPLRAVVEALDGVVEYKQVTHTAIVYSENSEYIKEDLSSAAKETSLTIGMQVSLTSDEDAQLLLDGLDDLAKKGINLLVIEPVNGFQYKSRPELKVEGSLSFEYARKIGTMAKALDIRIVPELNCVGHQSWKKTTGKLLTVYPDLDETIGLYPNNVGIYCRSWCPLNEDVNPIVFDLMDELINAFDADAFHVGMDEVFIIGDDNCPRCKGKNTGDLFAKAVNDYYQHLVVERGVTMYMWSDRLLDGKALGDVYSKWEASYNGTFTALDQISKDIILMDWHYEALEDYPSIDYLSDHGFQVITASYNNVEATKMLIEATLTKRSENKNVLGHLYTTWERSAHDPLYLWHPLVSTQDMFK